MCPCSVQLPTNATNTEEETRHQKARFFFFLVAWAVASVVVGMGTAVFAALAGGKVGLVLGPEAIFEIAACTMADTAVTTNNNQ